MFRGTHLLFALALVFLLFPLAQSAPTRERRRAARSSLLLRCCRPRSVLYLFVNYEYIVNRILYIDDLTHLDMAMAALAMRAGAGGDAARDRLGAADHRADLPRLCAAVHATWACSALLDQIYLTTEGIFGIDAGRVGRPTC